MAAAKISSAEASLSRLSPFSTATTRRGMLTLPRIGGCGRGVRRSDDGAERQRGIERQAGQCHAEAGDRGRAQHDGEDREREERLPEAAARDGREVEGGVDQGRGDEESKRRLGVQADLRRARE